MFGSKFRKASAADNEAGSARTVRRLRRAYLGLHGVAFDFAVKRAKKRFGQVLDFTDSLVAKGETVEADASDMFETAKDKAADLMPKGRSTATSKAKKVKMTTERTPAKTAVTKTASKPKAKKAAKKPPARKAVTEKTRAKKTAAKKASPKKAPAAKAKTPAQKKTSPAAATANAANKYDAYIADVLRYDATAKDAVVKKIVDHLGIALSSRDGKFVACTDEAERTTVRESWLKKKLGLESVDEDLDARVMAVCDMMSADRFKNRVTFYYLLAKEDGKLTKL